MATVKPWREVRAKAAERTPDFEERVRAERDRIEKEIQVHEATLADLRRARAMTQATLAEAIGTSQGEVSRIERQADLYLSTLARYVEAMGGELEMVARFNDERVPITLGETAGHAGE
jgi:DNA-binding XRE family transcriptional regulator